MCKFNHKYLDVQINREVFIDKNEKAKIKLYVYFKVHICIYFDICIYNK